MENSDISSIFFGMVYHFHQPVDNFEFVIEDAFKKAYKPLIDEIFKNPEVKTTLHISGNLLEWFLEHKPEFIKKLKKMANRGQIEIIGGGYYEPIFSIIPYRDRIAQIEKLSSLIKKEFGLDVKGAWLSERVWEPNYPSFLNDAGLKYVIVDDNHFRSTGITENETFYTYITEDQGKTLRIFPINEKIRYLTPWKPTFMTFDYLKSVIDEKGDKFVLMISDAEKMGVWGTTHQICYIEGNGHLEGDKGKPFISAFFEQIMKNKWIKSITLSDYMEKIPAKGLVYLPTASYDKMEEWALLTPIRRKFEKLREELKDNPEKEDEYLFLKGGYWRYFLVKYPESNNMHKKMLHVRNKLLSLENQSIQGFSALPYKKRIDEAWNEIYKAQCNDCYWHGLFGGVYLQFLRFAVYSHLINAERIIDSLNSNAKLVPENYISILPIDFNKDSKTDIIIESDKLNVYLDPSNGGTIFELDYKPKSYNLLNTLTRWLEAYHKENDIASNIVKIDRYRKSMLRARFFRQDITLSQLERDQYEELGTFIDGDFDIVRNEKDGKTALINLEYNGVVKVPESTEINPCKLIKEIVVQDSQIDIIIKGQLIKVPGKEENLKKIVKTVLLGIDLPFFFNGDPNKFQWKSNQVLSLDESKKSLLEPFEFNGHHLLLFDETYDLHVEFQLSNESKIEKETIKISKFPIITYAFTDEGYKEIYQGITLIPLFKIKKEFEYHITLSMY
jgi:hypothetical protein